MRACLIAWVLVLVSGPGLPGQDLIYLGDTLDSWWPSPDGKLIVQAGTRLFPFNLKGESSPCLDETRPPGFLPAEKDLKRATFFDVAGDTTLLVERGSYRFLGAATTSGSIPAPFYRFPWDGVPIRLPLILSASTGVVPGRPDFLLVERDRQSKHGRLALEAEGEANLGWGLGDDMVVTTVMPHMLLRRASGAAPDALVAGREGRYTLHPLDGTSRRTLQSAPMDDEEGVLDIPYDVAPLLSDLDGKGGDDLVLTDPSSGTLVLYMNLEAENPKVTRVIKPGGLILFTWVGDFNGDHREDIAVLRLPPLNPLLQLRVIRKGEVRAQVMIFSGGADGPSASPEFRLDLVVPLRVGIRNGIRDARLPMTIVPLSGPSLLVVEPTGGLYHHDLGEKKDRVKVGQVPAGAAPPTRRSLMLPDGRALLAWQTATDARIYCVGPF